MGPAMVRSTRSVRGLVLALAVLGGVAYGVTFHGWRLGSAVTIAHLRVTESRGTLDVVLLLHNRGNDADTARVFWLLSGPGEGSEWSRRSYQSAMRTVRIPAATTVTVAWTESRAVAPGSYRLSAWAHTPQASGFAHAASRLGPTVRFDEANPDLLRARPAPADLSVAALSGTVEGRLPSTVSAGANIANRTDRFQSVTVRFALVPLGDDGLGRWWRHEAEVALDAIAVGLAPGETRRLNGVGPAALPPGAYVVRATVDPQVLGGTEPLDDVAWPTPLVVF